MNFFSTFNYKNNIKYLSLTLFFDKKTSPKFDRPRREAHNFFHLFLLFFLLFFTKKSSFLSTFSLKIDKKTTFFSLFYYLFSSFFTFFLLKNQLYSPQFSPQNIISHINLSAHNDFENLKYKNYHLQSIKMHIKLNKDKRYTNFDSGH